jgi:DNA repair protein RecN (Recombination protein N)
VRAAHDSLAAIAREIDQLRARRAEAERRADYLRHLVKELDDAKLVAGEETQLEEEARRLEHADELRSLASGMAAALEGDENAALPLLAQVQKSLGAIQRIDPALGRLQEMFDGGFYALQELSRELDGYARAVDLDPARLDAVQARRDLLFRLLKKYGPTVEDALATARTSRAELDLVDTADLDLRQLETKRESARAALTASAAELTAKRTAAAARLAKEVDAILPDLGMPDGHFRAALVARAEIAATGAEDVEFRVALNVGHDARPLARVASGGELSRVMLALKTILARLDDVPTLVFDEVDAGIGGAVGLQVGDTMRRVAAHHQVLAISHLPQIAARAHHHIVVSKGARGGITTADTAVVEGEARIAEVARMLGGDPESAVSRAHARELLATAAAGGSGAPREKAAARKR